MSEKKPLNLAIPVDLLDEFNRVCQQYGHAKQKGMVLSAAMLMFLRAEPQTQGRYLEDIAKAQIRDGVQRMLERIKREQGLLVAAGEAAKRAEGEGAGDAPAGRVPTGGRQADPVPSAERPRKAAKKAGKAIHKVRKLKSPEDLTGGG